MIVYMPPSLSSLFFLVVFMTGCASIQPPPEPEKVPVNFDVVFAQVDNSETVVTRPVDRARMQRVLLSPNIVFESSRSSLRDPWTVGPRDSQADPNHLEDAVGAPVDIPLSTALIRYLETQDTVMVAPAISRVLEGEANESPMRYGTWVETIMRFHSPKNASAFEDQELPTTAFAVRHLGLRWQEVFVDVERLGDRYRAFPSQPGGTKVCRNLRVEVPVLVFEAELLNLDDGQIFARVSEAISADVSHIELEQHVVRALPQLTGNGWMLDDTEFCANIEKEIRTISSEVAARFNEKERAAMIIERGLQPLFN